MSESFETHSENVSTSWASTVSLSRLLESFVLGWKFVAGAIGAAIVVAVLYLAMATPRYEISIVVGPAPSATAMSPGAELGGAGNGGVGNVVSSFLGIQSTGSPDFIQFLDTLTSYEVAARLEKKHHFLERLMAGQWDEKTRTWKRHWGISGIVNSIVYGIMGVSTWHEPDVSDLQGFLNQNIVISNIGLDTDARKISMIFPKTDLAREILLADIEEANSIAKSRALERTAIIIRYANDRLNDVSRVVGRDILTQIQNENISEQLLASTPLPYAAQLRDQVYVSDMPVSPKPFLILVLALMAGLLIGGAAAIFFYY